MLSSFKQQITACVREVGKSLGKLLSVICANKIKFLLPARSYLFALLCKKLINKGRCDGRMRLLGTFSFVKKLTIMFAMTAAYVAGEMVYNFLTGYLPMDTILFT